MASETEVAAGQTKVFISYSRQDNTFVAQLAEALDAHEGTAVFRDTEDILPTEEWRARLETLIGEADAIVFCLSRHSTASKVCAWEVEVAERLNKRIIPILLESVDGDVPGSLSKLNYVHFTEPSNFKTALGQLISALETDITWVREHTRLGALARRWDQSGRPADQLLRGNDIAAAESWAARRPGNAPEPTEVDLVFIEGSRRAAITLARRERLRNRLVTAGALTALAIVSALGWFFYQSSQDALRAQSLYLADLAQVEMGSGEALTGMLVALEGVRDDNATNLTQRIRPRVPEALFALDTAWRGRLELARLEGHRASVSGVSFSPNGRVILTYSANDTKALLWDAATGKQIAEFAGTPAWTGGVYSAEFSSDGSRVLTADYDGKTIVWDAVTGKKIVQREDSRGSLTGALFSPDGRRVLTKFVGTSALKGGTVLWDVATGQESTGFPPSDAGGTSDSSVRVVAAAFSPDSSLLVLGQDSRSWKGAVAIWEAASGRELVRLTGHDGFVGYAVFSPDGTRVLTSSHDGTARIWETATGKELIRLKGHRDQVSKAVFSADGKRVLTASSDQTARLWDAETGRELHSFAGHGAPVTEVQFAPDGLRFLTVAGGKVRLWGEESSQPLLVIEGDTHRITTARFSPDGATVLTGSDDGTARLWTLEKGRAIAQIKKGLGVQLEAAAFSRDGTLVATGHGGQVSVWDAATGNGRFRFAAADNTRPGPGIISKIAFSRDGSRILTASLDHTARLWDAATGKELVRYEDRGMEWVWDAALSPDGSRVVTVSREGDARLFDAATGRLLFRLEGHGFFPNHRMTAAFSPDGTRVITAGNGTARISDVRHGKQIALMDYRGVYITSAAFSPDGSKVVTTSADGTARIWADSGGTEIARFNQGGLAEHAEFSPDGRSLVVVSSSDGTRLPASSIGVSIWDIGTQRRVSRIEGATTIAAFSPEGRRLVTDVGRATAAIWPVFPTPQDLVERVKQDTPRCLTPQQREYYHLANDVPSWCHRLKKPPYDK